MISTPGKRRCEQSSTQCNSDGTSLRQVSQSGVASAEIRAIPVLEVGDVFPGDSVADLVVDALALGGLRLHDGDMVVIKHKIVSKAEDRRVALDSVKPSAEARRFAERNGQDARVVELALREAKRVVRKKHVLITQTRARICVRQQRRGRFQCRRRQDGRFIAGRSGSFCGANTSKVEEADWAACAGDHLRQLCAGRGARDCAKSRSALPG